MAAKKKPEDELPDDAKVDPNAEIDDKVPAAEQCPVENAEGVRCLFEVHDSGDHAFTEEDAARIEAEADNDGDTGTGDEPGDGPEAAPEDDAAGEGNGDAPEASAPEPLEPARVSQNTWWCGTGDDAAMPHSALVCSKCGTPRLIEKDA